MAISAEFSAWVEELFAAFGPVRVKRMFGGAGIFHDDLMIGLVSDGTIYLRTDEETAPVFLAEGSVPFAYSGKGKMIELPYWRLPERLIDDPDELAEWVKRAHAAAVGARTGTKGRGGR